MTVHELWSAADRRWGMLPHPAGSRRDPPLTLVTVERMNRLALAGVLQAGVTRGSDVVGLHIVESTPIGTDRRTEAELEMQWALHPATRSKPLLTESMSESVANSVRAVAVELSERGRSVIVVVPQLLHSRRWHRLLHDQTGKRIERALSNAPGVVALVVPVPTAVPSRR